MRFKSPDILFATGSPVIKSKFKNILDDFFPRYLNILTNRIYKDKINEVRVEGHTSSHWLDASRQVSYVKNMALSQARAKNVLEYTYGITRAADKKWLEGVFRANGMSFAKLIKQSDGKENKLASQRVEFRVLTHAEEKIYKIIEKLR